MASSEAIISQREREINEIAKSIHTIAEIFKELQTLIIDQGTLLDRIDYNVEQMSVNVKSAVRELDKVKKELDELKSKVVDPALISEKQQKIDELIEIIKKQNLAIKKYGNEFCNICLPLSGNKEIFEKISNFLNPMPGNDNHYVI